MSKLNDFTGQRFGMLLVVKREGSTPSRQALWLCKCDCGKETLVTSGNLKRGHTRSCGCYREQVRPNLHRTHGGSGSRLYKIYHGMKKRCYNPKARFYERYGGRGITVCDEWLSGFEVFREWALANGYRDDLSIDRVENDGPYAPWNCRWEKSKAQRRNRKDIIAVVFRGEEMCLEDAAKIAGIPYITARKRIKDLGWDIDKALSTPVRRKK